MAKRICAVIFLTLSLVLGAGHQKYCLAFQDSIVAIVNDDIITLKDLKDYLTSIFMRLKMDGYAEEDIHEIMQEMNTNGINKLIEDKLILKAANDLGLEVREKIVDERIEKIRRQYPTDQDFIDALLNQGASITDLKNRIRDQLKINFLVDMQVRDVIVVNPKEVTDYYKNNFERFKKPDRVRLDSIFVASNGSAVATRKKADEALRRLKSGEDFVKIAGEYSSRPPVGIIEKGQMQPQMEKVLFELPGGALSPIMSVDGGLYIFQVKEKLPSEVTNLEEVKDKITQILFEQKFRENFKIWIDKLKKDSFIEIK